MTLAEFLFSVAWKFSIGFIWFKNLLFRVLPRQNTNDSLKCLFIMALIVLILHLILFRRRRTGWSSTACVLLPFGLYTVQTYCTTAGTFIRIVVGASLMLSLAYSILLLTAGITRSGKRPHSRILRRRLLRCAYSTSCITAVAMLTLMLGIGWNSYFGTALMSPKVKAALPEAELIITNPIADNMDTVLKLRPSVWEQQSTRQRLDILQTVCNIEAYRLGLSDPVTVQGDNLSPSTLGSYEDDSRLIRINLDHLETGHPIYDVLFTLCHEVRHGYQHRLAEAYRSASPEHQTLRLFREASRYSREVDNPIQPQDNYDGYKNQHMEIDSDRYAEQRVEEYCDLICNWLDENNPAPESTESSIKGKE